MSEKIVWTEGQDTQIRRLRTEGAPWDIIALLLGLNRAAVIERARHLGVERPPANAATALDEAERAPLPAGHAATWHAINHGTLLEDTAFLTPDSIR